LHIKKPSTYILNIGIEESKGYEYHQAANIALKKEKNINYQGFIEPREAMNMKLDILVSDGYSGNIMLKSVEGAGMAMNEMIKQTLKSKFK
jgi:glycerol-3-phosphate acyltransferase PlsX